VATSPPYTQKKQRHVQKKMHIKKATIRHKTQSKISRFKFYKKNFQIKMFEFSN